MKQILLSSMVACIVIFSAIFLAGSMISPWYELHWGKIATEPAPSVTVSGMAKSEQQSQIATFNFGVNVTSDNKDTAVSEVNKKMTTIIEGVKSFGIADSDIKTSNLNVYQNEEQYYEDGRQKIRPGQWRVSNTVDVKLREVDRAPELVDFLTQSGANNIYGPNFSLDDTDKEETALLGKAIENARQKANIAAQAANRKLGRILVISEGTSSVPYGYYKATMEGGGGGGIEPGSGTISKYVSVTFEMK
jgi:uncharacterized protein YggE